MKKVQKNENKSIEFNDDKVFFAILYFTVVLPSSAKSNNFDAFTTIRWTISQMFYDSSFYDWKIYDRKRRFYSEIITGGR